MVDYNMSDREQVDMLKKWWNDYGKAIAIAIAIGLIVSFGWRYWRQYESAKVQEASALYDQLSLASAQNKKDQAKAIADKLLKSYSSSPYATMASLWSASAAIKDKNYQEALEKEQWVLKNSDNARFRQIARIRAARILLFMKKPEAALDLLKKVDDKTFDPLVSEVKGDIYTALNKTSESKKAYQSAKTGLTAEGVRNPVLDMKLAQP